MFRFKFSLESVLHYKEMLEEDRKHHLATALQRHEQEQMILARYQQNYAALKRWLPEGCMDINQWQYQDMLADYLWQEIEQQKQVVAKAENEVVICRDKVKKAMCERKLIDRLKEKQAMEYRYETNRRELFVSDELALIAFNFKGKEL